MNTKDYIESGILEAYLLGALSAEEELLVEANVAQFPELKEELRAIEKAMEQYSQGLATEPPADMEDKIWNTIQAQSAGEHKQQAVPKVIAFKPEHQKGFNWKYAATLVFLVGSLALNAMLYNQGRENKSTIKDLSYRTDMAFAELNDANDMLTNYQKANTMMADTGMQTIVMHTMLQGHPMAATLYWTKSKGEAYVAMNALPQPPQGMQYQLWVIQGGKPISMGVLPNEMANTPGMQKVPMQVMSGEAFAISLEKAGGNPTPTVVYVLGKA